MRLSLRERVFGRPNGGKGAGSSPEELQHAFYSATADRDDEEMAREGDEPFVALAFISALIDGYGYENVLDVGAGTGRGVHHFLSRHDGIEVRGVETVR